MKKILSASLFFAASIASAAQIDAPVSRMKFIQSYNQWGGGDVIFATENAVSGCENGYWLAKSDTGFSANMAMLLSAYHAKSPLVVSAITDQQWAGSAGHFCKLYAVTLQ